MKQRMFPDILGSILASPLTSLMKQLLLGAWVTCSCSAMERRFFSIENAVVFSSLAAACKTKCGICWKSWSSISHVGPLFSRAEASSRWVCSKGVVPLRDPITLRFRWCAVNFVILYPCTNPVVVFYWPQGWNVAVVWQLWVRLLLWLRNILSPVVPWTLIYMYIYTLPMFEISKYLKREMLFFSLSPFLLYVDFKQL